MDNSMSSDYQETVREELTGLYRFCEPYPLFDDPKHYHYTQRIYSPEGAPRAIVTGKVFERAGLVLAVEIITVHNDHPIVCWTSSNVLTRSCEYAP